MIDNKTAAIALAEWGRWKNHKGSLKRESERETGCLRRSSSKSRIEFDEPAMNIIEALYTREETSHDEILLTERQRIIMTYEYFEYPWETQQWKTERYNKGVVLAYDNNDYKRILISHDVYRKTVESIKRVVARELRFRRYIKQNVFNKSIDLVT